MAGGKLSGRQKMINMMYLVLTALLALNVSKEIIKAFNQIENSLDKSAGNLNDRTKQMLGALAKKAEDPATAAKAGPYHKRAEQAHKIAEDFVTYIRKTKEDLEKLAGGRKPDEEGATSKSGGIGNKNELSGADNMEVHANYFMVENGGARGKEIRKKINDTRIALAKLLNTDTSDGCRIQTGRMEDIEKQTSLRAEDGKNSDGTPQSWESMTLEHAPLAAVFAILSKVENDARNLEGDVINELAKSIDATDFKFDKLEAKVMAASSYVMVGTPYEAEILLVASNTKANNKVFVGGNPITIENGVGKYKVTPQSVGEQTLKGNIEVPDPMGGTKSYPFETKYSSFKPFASVAADEMNLFYVGLDNPITVSVPGVNPNNVTVNMTGGGSLVTSGGGKYQAKFTSRVPEVQVNVSAKMPDGKVQNMGSTRFRVRNLPMPLPKLGTIDGSKAVTKNELSLQKTLFASMGEGFAYESVKYSVVQFTVMVAAKGQPPRQQTVSGNNVGSVSAWFSNLKSGDVVSFFGIRAQGPGGTRPIPGLTVQVQ
jgi:gliding motility-associated protein GldM